MGASGPLLSSWDPPHLSPRSPGHISLQLREPKSGPGRPADTRQMPRAPSAGEMGPGARPEPPKVVEGGQESSCKPQSSPNSGPAKAMGEGRAASPPLAAGCGEGLWVWAWYAWQPRPGHAGAMAPARPCTESFPSSLARQPVWLSARPACLSSAGLHASLTQLPCQQGSACPALRFVASCAAGQASDESPVQRVLLRSLHSSAGRLCGPCPDRARGHRVGRRWREAAPGWGAGWAGAAGRSGSLRSCSSHSRRGRRRPLPGSAG